MRSLPTRPSSRRAASSKASGEGRLSAPRRSSAISHRYYRIIPKKHRSLRWANAMLHHLLARPEPVEREIERQHVHARLAQNAEKALLGVIADQLAQLILGQVAHPGHASHLEQGGLGRDVGIEPAG